MSFNSGFDDWQVLFLKIESLIILAIYLFMFVSIVDTMRLHKIFSGGNNFSLNLYLFYLLAIMVCLGRFLQETSLFVALQTGKN